MFTLKAQEKSPNINVTKGLFIGLVAVVSPVIVPVGVVSDLVFGGIPAIAKAAKNSVNYIHDLMKVKDTDEWKAVTEKHRAIIYGR